MVEMFKLFLENLETLSIKFSKIIYNLQDCTIDQIDKFTIEGESTYEETQRSVILLII